MHMDTATFDRVAEDFAAFHQHFAPSFGRPEARKRSEQYLRGLLLQHADRRNAENLAEAVPGATPRALQRFLTEAPWCHAYFRHPLPFGSLARNHAALRYA